MFGLNWNYSNNKVSLHCKGNLVQYEQDLLSAFSLKWHGLKMSTKKNKKAITELTLVKESSSTNNSSWFCPQSIVKGIVIFR